MKRSIILWLFRATALAVIILSWHAATRFAIHNYEHGNVPCVYIALAVGVAAPTVLGFVLWRQTFKE